MNITMKRIAYSGLLSLLLTLNGRAQDYSVPVQSVTQLYSYIESAWTNSYLPQIMPPDMGSQQIDLGAIQYTESFDTNLLSAMTRVTNAGICQFQMTAVETNSPTHQRLWLNATGGLISTWSILYARANWITQTYGEMPSYYEAGSTEAVAWAAARSPERISATLFLLSTNDYPAYLAALTNSVGGAADTNGQVISLLTLYSNDVAFVGISLGNPARLSLHTPTSTVQIGVFGSTDLLGADWSQLTTLPRTTDPILWNYHGFNELRIFALGDMRDSDGDGIADVVEELITKTDPTRADSDGDGLSDGAEWRQYATNPLAYSSSGSGLPDGWLVSNGLNPLNADVANQDPDCDTLSNAEEQQAGTDPLEFDNVLNVNPSDVVIQYRSQTIYHEKRGFLSFTERITPADVPSIYQHYTSAGGYERNIEDCENCDCHAAPSYDTDNSLRADALTGACGLPGDRIWWRDSWYSSYVSREMICTNIGQFHYIWDEQLFTEERDGETWDFDWQLEYRSSLLPNPSTLTATYRDMVPSASYETCRTGVVVETLSDPFTTAILTDLAWQRYDALPALSNAVAWGKSVLHTQNATTTNSASSSALHSVAASEMNISLTRNAYRFLVPTETGLVYRMYWAELFVDTNGNKSVEAPRSIAFQGTGGTVTVENADFVLGAPEDRGSRVIQLVNVDATRDWFVFDSETEAQDMTRGLVQMISRPGDAPTGQEAVWIDWYTVPDLSNCQVRVKKLASPRAAITCRLLDEFTGEVLLDTNQSERVWSLADAPWGLTPDSTAGGICDVELTLEQGEHVLARDRTRIHFIPATPASGPVVYVDPSATHHQAPYNALGNRAANTLDEAIQHANGITNANVLIIAQSDPSLWPIESYSPQISRAMTISGVAGRWANTNTFDYSGLPNIRSFTYGPLVWAANMTNSADQFGIRLGGLQFERGLALSGGAGSFSNVSVAIELGLSTIISNRANDFGGGLFFERCPNVSIHNSVFTDNLASHDAGYSVVYDKGMGGALAAISSTVVIANCVFDNNAAEVSNGGEAPQAGSAGGGGDIYQHWGSLSIAGSSFNNGRAGFPIDPANPVDVGYFTGDGGSLLVHGTKADTVLNVADSSFVRSQSFGNGGAISISKNSDAANRSYFETTLGGYFAFPYPDTLGGGCSGTISRCTFLETKGGWQGGAINACGRDVLLLISDCRFQDCKGGTTHTRDGKGGAVSFGGGVQWNYAAQGFIQINNCIADGCSASGNGGALYVTIRGQMDVANTTIDNCSALDGAHQPIIAGFGGGMYASAGGVLNVSTTTIAHCSAASLGGGLAVKSANATVFGAVTIHNCHALTNNLADGAGNGGGVAVSSSYYDDTTVVGAGYGAAVIYGHGYLNAGSAFVLTNCTAARWGGGLYVGMWPLLSGYSYSTLPSGVNITANITGNDAGTSAAGIVAYPSCVVFERSEQVSSLGASVISGATNAIGVYRYQDYSTLTTTGVTFIGVETTEYSE